MDRPIYETEADLKNEQDTARVIKNKWGMDLVKLPIKNKIDFLGKREGNPRAFIEIKNRTCKRSTYPTYMISLDKWVSGLSMEQHTGIPFILVIDWDDEVAYLRCSEVEVGDANIFNVNMGGRKDRGDAQDIEPVVHIHISQFKTLEKHNV